MASGSSPLAVLRSVRAWNISVRTAHLATMGVLLGGHAFDVSKCRLLPWLLACAASGAALVALESGGRLLWLHQGRGLATLVKLLLVALIPFFWEARFPILLGVVALAGVGSHMPACYRYYSVLRGEIIRDPSGPQGGASLRDRGSSAEDPRAPQE
jgi:hypothetical protein